MRTHDGLTILKHPGRAGERFAAEIVDEIQHVRAKHPEVLAAAAPVAFAASADFENLAKMSVGNKLIDHGEHGCQRLRWAMAILVPCLLQAAVSESTSAGVRTKGFSI